MILDGGGAEILKIESTVSNWSCSCGGNFRFVLKALDEENQEIGAICNIPSLKHRKLMYARDDNMSMTFPAEYSCEVKATLIGALFLIRIQHIQ